MCLGACRSTSSLTESRKEIVSELSKEHIGSTELTKSKTSTDTDQWLIQASDLNKGSVLQTSKDSRTDEYRSKETEVDIYDRLGNLRATIRSKEQSIRNDTAMEQTGDSSTWSESRKDSVYTKESIVSQTDTDRTSVSDKEMSSEQDIDIEINETRRREILAEQIVSTVGSIMMYGGVFYVLFIFLRRIIHENKNNK